MRGGGCERVEAERIDSSTDYTIATQHTTQHKSGPDTTISEERDCVNTTPSFTSTTTFSWTASGVTGWPLLLLLPPDWTTCWNTMIISRYIMLLVISMLCFWKNSLHIFGWHSTQINCSDIGKLSLVMWEADRMLKALGWCMRMSGEVYKLVISLMRGQLVLFSWAERITHVWYRFTSNIWKCPLTLNRY